MDIPGTMVLAGAILSALGAFWSASNQASESRQYAAKIDDYAKKQARSDSEVNALQKQLLDKADVQNAKTEEIAKLNAELAASQQEIAKLSIETANNVTGGDSFCYVTIIPLSNQKAQVILTHEGDYPLSEVKINIMLISKLKEFNEKLGPTVDENFFEKRNNLYTHFEMSTIPANNSKRTQKSAYPLGSVPYSSRNEETYDIEFIARNGIWKQEYKFRFNNNGKLRNSYSVYRKVVVRNKLKLITIKRESDVDFPKSRN